MKKRAGSIELYRFVCAAAIMCLHFILDNSEKIGGVKILTGASIGVEFFFIVSGFLMAKQADKMTVQPNEIFKSNFAFIWHKIKAFYPEYVVAFITAFIVKHAYGTSGLVMKKMLKDLLHSAPELFLTRNAGFMDNAYIQGSWYLSAMVIGLFIIFPLILAKKDLFLHYIAPVTAVVLLGLLCVNFGNLKKPTDVIWFGLYKGTVRGIAELCLGCVCYTAYKKLTELKLSMAQRIILGIVETCGYVGTVVFMQKYGGGKLDFTFAFILAVCVTISFAQVSPWAGIFNNKFVYFLGKISLPIYLAHGCFVNYSDKIIPGVTGYKLVIAYVGLTTANLCIIMVGAKLIRMLFAKIRSAKSVTAE